MKVGSTGAAVGSVQHHLGLPVTNVFDRVLSNKVYAWQVRHPYLLRHDHRGTVGSRTYTSITGWKG